MGGVALRDYLAGEVVEDFADGLLPRREALRRLGVLGMGIAASATALAACGTPSPLSPSPLSPANPTGAVGPPAQVPGRGPDTPRGSEVRFGGPAGELRGAWSSATAPRGAVLVIHENKGLTDHFYDVVGRFAGAGYSALCVDLLSAKGGTATLTDPAQAPAALAAAPVEGLVADLKAGIDELGRRAPEVKVGSVGFCFGGGMIWQLLAAGEPRLAAAIPFYGPAPEKPDFSRSKAAVLSFYGEKDARVDATKERADAALAAAGLSHDSRVYPGADHAFFNDTGSRYNPDAASQAWRATMEWFGRYL